MLDLSPEKLMVLLSVGLLVLGPNKLPAAARSLAHGLARARRLAATLTDPVTSNLAEPVRANFTEPLKTGLVDPLRVSVVEPLRAGLAEPVRSGLAEPVRSGLAQPVRPGVMADSGLADDDTVAALRLTIASHPLPSSSSPSDPLDPSLN